MYSQKRIGKLVILYACKLSAQVRSVITQDWNDSAHVRDCGLWSEYSVC